MRIPLAGLLVRSPLPRVEELMARVIECAEKVPELVEHLNAGNQEAVIELTKQTSVLEGKADDAKNDVRQHMPIRLFLPVDRRDVLRLISEIDAIADAAEDVGVLLTLRPLDVPEELQPLLRRFVDRVLDTVKSAGALVGMIDDLLEAGFGGQAADRVRAAIDEVHRKEHEADKIQDQCAKVLFKLEDQMSPVALFMWTKVLNKIGDMANHAENVGDQFRLFIAR
ncbi:MAG: TIGR00153 family protein [Myxococcota bacterium]